MHIAPHIARAVASGAPVVALETALIAHGLPPPFNLEVALQAEDLIRQGGAQPATIGVVAGRPTIGLTADEINLFANREGILKTNISNLAWTITRQAWGGTTVSATMKLAYRAGIRVLMTGGIGGVHRGVEKTWDISSDLPVLAETPMFVVCSGTKAILDVRKTFEYLETMGVPVIGYQTDQFPAFFSRTSGVKLDMMAATLEEAVRVGQTHWATGHHSAVIVAVPIPSEAEIPQPEVEAALSHALAEAEQAQVVGKALTPYLLSTIEKLTAGRSLRANVALLLHNAQVAAALSRTWANTTS